MRRFSWQIKLVIAFVVLSVLLYLMHYAIFQDPHHIFIYMLGDIAFIPLEVLLVTLVIHRVLSQRERRSRLEKLNMVIGAFFSEVGTALLTYFSDFDPRLDEVRKELVVTDDWSEQTFLSVSKRLARYDYKVDIQKVELENLRIFLKAKRDFLLRLLENPTLLEHESFSELLQGVFHLTEELEKREGFIQLPQADYEHLATDLRRAYGLLVHEWLRYMKHLRYNYPYLFSLAIRTNPFDQQASVLVG
ncbi:MAG: hypothetical protein WBC55_01725 [Dehalococcoidia bacterium]